MGFLLSNWPVTALMGRRDNIEHTIRVCSSSSTAPEVYISKISLRIFCKILMMAQCLAQKTVQNGYLWRGKIDAQHSAKRRQQNDNGWMDESNFFGHVLSVLSKIVGGRIIVGYNVDGESFIFRHSSIAKSNRGHRFPDHSREVLDLPVLLCWEECGIVVVLLLRVPGIAGSSWLVDIVHRSRSHPLIEILAVSSTLTARRPCHLMDIGTGRRVVLSNIVESLVEDQSRASVQGTIGVVLLKLSRPQSSHVDGRTCLEMRLVGHLERDCGGDSENEYKQPNHLKKSLQIQVGFVIYLYSGIYVVQLASNSFNGQKGQYRTYHQSLLFFLNCP